MEQQDNIVNRQGISFRKICASCKYYVIGDKLQRFCNKYNTKVANSDVCDDFVFNPNLSDFGREKGVVHNRHYIEYLTQRMQIPVPVGEPKPTKEEITAEYISQFGNDIVLF